jgi:hypothetical protein
LPTREFHVKFRSLVDAGIARQRIPLPEVIVSVFTHRANLAGFAALTASLLAAGTGPALAATSHGASVKPAHSAPAAHRPADHLAGARKGATHLLAAYSAQLRRITAATAASAVLNATDREALATGQAGDLAALTADAQAIATATSVRSMRTVLLAATRTVQGARLQLHLVTVADQDESTGAALTDSAATLTASADSLQAAGTDVSTVIDPLAELATQVDNAETAAQAAATAALALTATPTITQLRTLTTAAHHNLATAAAALDTAQQDLDVATAALTALQSAPVA